jgi:hypothetical protein
LAGADLKATEMFNQMMDEWEPKRGRYPQAGEIGGGSIAPAKKEFGDEAGFAVDGYLALDTLRETVLQEPKQTPRHFKRIRSRLKNQDE